MNVESTTLDVSSTYDDQGLFFTLALGLVLTVTLGITVCCFVSSPVLWIKRLYRPNHVLEPPPRSHEYFYHYHNARAAAAAAESVVEAETAAPLPAEVTGLAREEVVHVSSWDGAGDAISTSTIGAASPPRRSSDGSPSFSPTLNSSTTIAAMAQEGSSLSAPFMMTNPLVNNFMNDTTGTWNTHSQGFYPMHRVSLRTGGLSSTTTAEAPSIVSRAAAAAVASPTSPTSRRKRLGISLPYASSLRHWPTWLDWISVEEASVPHLESALEGPTCMAPVTADGIAVGGSGEGERYRRYAVDDAYMTGTRGVVPLSSGGSPVVTWDPLTGRPASPTTRSYGSVDPCDYNNTSSRDDGGSGDNDGVAGDRQNISANASGAAKESAALPKTPLDPQVALYIFTLKYFITILLLGVCFTCWICPLAAGDDAIEWYMVRRDIHRCHRQDSNETGCLEHRPFCQYLGQDIGCTPVPLHGIYDLTVMNIRPHSNRWWGVGLLDLGFCAVFSVATVLLLLRITAYVELVMARQLKHALGHRVACLRGLEEHEMDSVAVLREKFLEEKAYFAPRARGVRRRHRHAAATGGAATNIAESIGTARSTTVTTSTTLARYGDIRSGIRVSGEYHTVPSVSSSDTEPSPDPAGATPPHDADQYHYQDEMVEREEDTEDDGYFYKQLDCSGCRCLFSVVGCHYYRTYRGNAVFTRPGKVLEVLLTRDAPRGAYKAIHHTEASMAALQEAIAEEKALQRQAAAAAAIRAEEEGGGGDSGEIGGQQAAADVPTDVFIVDTAFVENPLHSSSGLSPATPEDLVLAAEQAPQQQQQRFQGSALLRDRSRAVARGAAATSNAAAVRGYTEAAMVSREATGVHIISSGQPLLMMRAPFPSCCCSHVPAVQYRAKRFRSDAIELNRCLDAVPEQRASGAAFVVFADSLCAYEFVNLFHARYGGNALLVSASATIAGPPGHVIQGNVHVDRLVLAVRFAVLSILYVLLLIGFSLPVAFLGLLNDLATLPVVGPAFTVYNAAVPAWVRNILAAYLPVMLLALFNMLLPFLIRTMVIAMGAFNKTECDCGHMYLQYIFMVLTGVIFQAALQGGFTQLTDLAQDPNGEAIVNLFVACVTPQGGYWYAKVVMAACLTTWMDVLNVASLLRAVLFRKSARVQRSYDALFMPCEMRYPTTYSFDLVILSIGLLFHMTAPLLTVFAALFFVVRYATQRARLYDRYRPSLLPAQDCTDFSVSAQVMRAVMWLYCLSEVGAVLLMSVRNHVGGVLLCSTSLAVGLVLLVYVHVQTRKWITNLENVRAVYKASGAPLSATEAMPSATTAAAECSGESGGKKSTVSQTIATPTTTAAESRGGAPNNSHRRGDGENENGEDDNGEMDDYDAPRFDFFDSKSRNPFTGHLLPRKPGAGHRYQPKHQRLAHIDADAEIDKMENTEFIVERYWDRNVTWFEATDRTTT